MCPESRQARDSCEQQARAKNDLAYLLALEDRELDYALRLAQDALSEFDNSFALNHTLGYVYLRKQSYVDTITKVAQ